MPGRGGRRGARSGGDGAERRGAAMPDEPTAELHAVALFEVIRIDVEVDADGNEGAVTVTLGPVELAPDERPPVTFSFAPGAYRLVLVDADVVELEVGQRLALGMPLMISNMAAAEIDPETILPREP